MKSCIDSLYITIIHIARKVINLWCVNMSVLYYQESGACQTDPNCVCALDVCYYRGQTVDIDHCWFMVPSADLDKNGSVVITVFNQALLTKGMTFQVRKLYTF